MIERPKELTTPEQLHGYIADLEQYGRQMDLDKTTLSKEQETSSQRIKDLEEHNQRLFAKAESFTKSEKDEKEEETFKPLSIEEMAQQLAGKEEK